jgi:cytochrome c peroxidase
MFHDGRVESHGKTVGKNGDDGQGIRTPDTPFGTQDPLAGQNLAQAQARFPVTSPEEMKGFNYRGHNNQAFRDYLASRLGNYGEGKGELYNITYWLDQFRTTLNKPNSSAQELITEQNIFFLIGEYERSQSFVETPWKRYVEGDNTALSESAKKGALLFFNSVADGGANCSSCHSGDFFTDEKSHNLAMPQIGRGKGDGDDKSEDFGRFRETQADEDKFAFRTPTLLNIEVTGPWGHTGAYTSLEAVVRHNLDPEAAVSNYDTNQLAQTGIQNLDKVNTNTQKALDKLLADRLAGKSVIEKVSLTDEQVAELVEFLKALTDPCVKDRNCLAKWVVDPINGADPSGDQLNAVNEKGEAL